MKPVNRFGWAEVEEIEFINKLGSWAPEHKFSRANLLRQYRAALEFRTAWGRIDRGRVIFAADHAIKTTRP